jgi:hypothetical protein
MMSSPRKEIEEAAMRKPRSSRALIGRINRCQDFAAPPKLFIAASHLQHPPPTSQSIAAQRQDAYRDVLLLLFAGVSVEGYNFRYVPPRAQYIKLYVE